MAPTPARNRVSYEERAIDASARPVAKPLRAGCFEWPVAEPVQTEAFDQPVASSLYERISQGRRPPSLYRQVVGVSKIREGVVDAALICGKSAGLGEAEQDTEAGWRSSRPWAEAVGELRWRRRSVLVSRQSGAPKPRRSAKGERRHNMTMQAMPDASARRRPIRRIQPRVRRGCPAIFPKWLAFVAESFRSSQA